MDWKRERSGQTTTGEDGRIYWMILAKRNGKFYVEAYQEGGAERRLPFQDFDSEEAAMAWVERSEEKWVARKARVAAEKPIRF